MKRTSMMMKVLLLGVSLLPFALPVVAQAVTVKIVSDSTWTVTDTNGNYLGNTQNVCLMVGVPLNCPANATLYGYTAGAWTANLSSIPGATWIWAPNITGSTASAANAEFTFTKEFYICGPPQGGTISVAADDSAEVFLNGTRVLSSTNPSMLSTVTITSGLRQSPEVNVIVVKVKNGPNPSLSCPSGQYRCNPAGVVLGASFGDGLAVLPKCTHNGKQFTAGDSETLTCPPGQTGVIVGVCACVLSQGYWLEANTCKAAPKTCIGKDGSTTFDVGDVESQSCPAGQIGSPPTSHKCLMSGSWDVPLGACAVPPPPVTCTGANGQTFPVDSVETLPCPTGQIGSPTPSHKCLASGQWGPTSGTCTLPEVGVGDICGGTDKVPPKTATCPAGTECKSRSTPGIKPPWWCIFVPFLGECQGFTGSKSTDWYCDP